MTARKRRRSHGSGRDSAFTHSLGLSQFRAVTAILLAALAATSSSPVSDQHEEADHGTSRTAGTHTNRHSSQQVDHVGEALHLSIDEPGADQNGNDVGDNNHPSKSQLVVPHLLHLTEENFVSTFQDMFDGGNNENDASPSEDNDAILCLFAVYSPECLACEPILRGLNHVAGRIASEYDETIAPRWDARDTSAPPPPIPVLGMLNGANVTHGFYTKLEPMAVYPTLKFSLVQRLTATNHAGDEEAARDENGAKDVAEIAAPDVAIQIFDYVGPSAHTMDDVDGLMESIWHYWYRYVAARRTNMAKTTIDPPDENADQHVVALQSPPVFTVPSILSAISFLKKHGDSVLKPVPFHIPVQLNEEERQYFSNLLQPTREEEEDGLGEPVTIFAQCRSSQGDDATDAKTAK